MGEIGTFDIHLDVVTGSMGSHTRSQLFKTAGTTYKTDLYDIAARVPVDSRKISSVDLIYASVENMPGDLALRLFSGTEETPAPPPSVSTIAWTVLPRCGIQSYSSKSPPVMFDACNSKVELDPETIGLTWKFLLHPDAVASYKFMTDQADERGDELPNPIARCSVGLRVYVTDAIPKPRTGRILYLDEALREESKMKQEDEVATEGVRGGGGGGGVDDRQSAAGRLDPSTKRHPASFPAPSSSSSSSSSGSNFLATTPGY